MNALQRRLQRLEAVNGRHIFTDFSDEEMDARLRRQLAEWIASDPDACPPVVRAEVASFLDGADAGS